MCNSSSLSGNSCPKLANITIPGGFRWNIGCKLSKMTRELLWQNILPSQETGEAYVFLLKVSFPKLLSDLTSLKRRFFPVLDIIWILCRRNRGKRTWSLPVQLGLQPFQWEGLWSLAGRPGPRGPTRILWSREMKVTDQTRAILWCQVLTCLRGDEMRANWSLRLIKGLDNILRLYRSTINTL